MRPARPGDPSDRDFLLAVANLAADGKFKMHVEKTFPLEQAGNAQELSRQGHTEGKLILAVEPGRAGAR